jgi:hypothetical protein
VLVESDVRDLCFCATPVVPELGGGEGCEKPPRSGRRRSLLDPCTSPSEILVAPPVAARHLASLIFSPPAGVGKKKLTSPQTVSGWLSCPRAKCYYIPCPFAVSFHHLSDRVVAVRTLPLWFTLLEGRLYEQCVVTITQGTLHEVAFR